MKKLFLLIFALAMFGISYAQNNTDFSTDTLPYFKKTPADIQQATNEQSNLRSTSVFIDFGPSLLTLNGDMRFQRKLNGFGARVGIGYSNFDGESVLTVPLMLNYLLGKNGKYFEMGAGATITHMEGSLYGNETIVNSPGLNTPERKVSAFGMLNFGYRRQPLYGGFLFRVGIAPVFGNNYFMPIPYLSFGYGF